MGMVFPENARISRRYAFKIAMSHAERNVRGRKQNHPSCQAPTALGKQNTVRNHYCERSSRQTFVLPRLDSDIKPLKRNDQNLGTDRGETRMDPLGKERLWNSRRKYRHPCQLQEDEIAKGTSGLVFISARELAGRP
jgi:hypothetical protein